MTHTAITSPTIAKAGPCVLSTFIADKDNPRRAYVQSFTAQKIVYTHSKRFAYKFASAKDCEQSWVYRFFQGDSPEIELAL